MQSFPLFSLGFLFSFILFLLSSLCSFYLPGRLLLHNRKLSFGLQLFLSFVVGIVLWGIQAYMLGYLHLRMLTYLYLLSILIIAYRRKIPVVSDMLQSWNFIKDNILLSIFVLIGVIGQMIIVIGSGVMYPDGLRFIGGNGVDGVMHLAYIRSIVHYFPPIEPGLAGHPLVNYHYWSDLIIAELIRIWHIPTTHAFFQFFPLFISSLTAFGAYQLMKYWGFSRKAGILAIFFLFFGGDATYALLLLIHQKLNFVTPAIDNGADQFFNMPNAFARPIFLAGILTLGYWIKEKSWFYGVITAAIFISLVGIKIYYGIFVLFGLSLLVGFLVIKELLRSLKEKRLRLNEQRYLLPFILVLIGAAAVYLPANQASGGLIFAPLEWPKIFIGPDVINWGDWWLRQNVYSSTHNYKSIVVIDAIAVIIALISIHGTRLLGLLPSRLIYRRLGWEMIIFLLPTIFVFHLLGLFTLQVSGGLNVFNFFAVSTVVMSLLTAMLVDTALFARKKLIGSILLVLIILLTVPRVIYEDIIHSKELLNPQTNSFLISNDELAAFAYIRNHTPKDAIVQSDPTDAYDSQSPYVSFGSDRLTYVSGVFLQRTHNQPVDGRLKEVKNLFMTKTSPALQSTGKSLGIDYLYLKKTKKQDLSFKTDPNLVRKVFENKTVVVYQIVK